MKNNIILIGLRNSGKTTVGNLLAKQLKLPFIDTDAKLLTQYQHIPNVTNIAALYQHLGATKFRQQEGDLIQQYANITNSVIATGGGTTLSPLAKALLPTMGIIFYLKLELAEFLIRNQGFQNFAANESNLSELYNARHYLCQQLADYQLVTNCVTLTTLVDQIIGAYRQHGI